MSKNSNFLTFCSISDIKHSKINNKETAIQFKRLWWSTTHQKQPKITKYITSLQNVTVLWSNIIPSPQPPTKRQNFQNVIDYLVWWWFTIFSIFYIIISKNTIFNLQTLPEKCATHCRYVPKITMQHHICPQKIAISI